jgi:hypothetical protein
MSQGREIRSYDYVNHSYASVRDALTADATGVFQKATKAAASRVESVAAELHVNIGGVDVGTEIAVSVGEAQEKHGATEMSRVTRIPITWKAANHPSMFPLMSAELSVYPLTATETQLDFLGRYEPPLGVLGDAVNAVLGHKIAEASVHRFVADVAHYLRTNLA